MVVYGMILYFVYGRLIKLVEKDDAAKVQVTQGLSLLDDPTEYNFLETNFTVGIAAFSPDMSVAYDLRGLLDLKGTQVYFINDGVTKMVKEPIDTVRCEEDPT